MFSWESAGKHDSESNAVEALNSYLDASVNPTRKMDCGSIWIPATAEWRHNGHRAVQIEESTARHGNILMLRCRRVQEWMRVPQPLIQSEWLDGLPGYIANNLGQPNLLLAGSPLHGAGRVGWVESLYAQRRRSTSSCVSVVDPASGRYSFAASGSRRREELPTWK